MKRLGLILVILAGTVLGQDKAPSHVTLSGEESARIRIRLLRAEKLSVEIERLKAELRHSAALFDAELKEITTKYGVKDIQDYDVVNGESESDRPILLKRKAKEPPAKP